MILRRALLGLACAVFLVAIALACSKNVARFPHQRHLGLDCSANPDSCLTCVSCHASVTKGGDGHPSDTDCSRCHASDPHTAQATLQAPKTPARQQATSIHFDHARHLAMGDVGGQCISCHAGVVSEQGKPNFPPMARCFECHEHKAEWDRGECVPCHEPADLRQLFPQTFLRHGPGWDHKHAAAAANSTAQCAQCHTTESCDDCHDVSQDLRVETRQMGQVQKDFVHPADFITRHSMEAASEPARCLSCHRTETCDSCHTARGVSAGRAGAVNPHPPGWTGPDSSSPQHHGRQARRDIVSCASCHDQGPATNCIQCHRVGGAGGNPHPQGWHSTRTPDDVMCSYCHGGP